MAAGLLCPLIVCSPSESGSNADIPAPTFDCCLRANKDSRPLQCLIFRGSIPHPMQWLCTLRNHCRQWSRNTRYQADATPDLARAFTGGSHQLCLAQPIQSPRRRASERSLADPGPLPAPRASSVNSIARIPCVLHVGARAVQRFWYGWKMWSFAFTATWHACPQSEGLGSAENLSDAAS
jgi:hypothetical protein